MDSRKRENVSSLKHFVTIGGGTLINMILSIISIPIIVRLVEPEIYGQVALYNVYVDVGLFVFCLGLDQALVRFFYHSEDCLYKRALITRCWMFPTITLGIVALCVGIGKNIFGFLDSVSNVYLLLLAVGIFTQVLYRISLMLLRLQYQSKQYALTTVMCKFLYIVFALIGIVLISDSFFICLVISTILSTVISILIALFHNKKLYVPVFNNHKLDGLNSIELLKYGSPFIISLGVVALYNAVSKLCISMYCDFREVGIYASATAVMGIFGVITTTFNSLWSPMAMKHYIECPEDRDFHARACKIITVIMFLFGISVMLCKDVIVIFLGDSYSEAVNLIPFLAFQPIMYTISESTVRGIEFFKKSNYHIIISLVSLLANIFGNLLLIPMMGIKGAAVSTGLSYILFFILRSAFSVKLYRVNYEFWKIAILCIMTICYAWHCAYFEFSCLNILFYIAEVLLIIFLYKATVQCIIGELKKFFVGMV